MVVETPTKAIPCRALVTRSATFFIYQNTTSMKNFKKQLENQQKINEAAKAIIDHFTDVDNYSSHYESMANATVQIMQLIELNQRVIAIDSGIGKGEMTDDIPGFLWDVTVIYKLLKPFAEMVGQVYGEKD